MSLSPENILRTFVLSQAPPICNTEGVKYNYKQEPMVENRNTKISFLAMIPKSLSNQTSAKSLAFNSLFVIGKENHHMDSP